MQLLQYHAGEVGADYDGPLPVFPSMGMANVVLKLTQQEANDIFFREVRTGWRWLVQPASGLLRNGTFQCRMLPVPCTPHLTIFIGTLTSTQHSSSSQDLPTATPPRRLCRASVLQLSALCASVEEACSVPELARLADALLVVAGHGTGISAPRAELGQTCG